MNEDDFKSLSVFVIILIIAICLSFVGSQGGVTVFGGIPVFALGIIITFVIQWVAFIPAYLNRTEKFFDLTGALTYCTVVIITVFLSETPDLRSLLLMLLVIIWAIRLGLFLFMRIRKEGEDKRFQTIKQSASRFLLTWTIQGLWVSFTLAAVLAAMTGDTGVEFGLLGLIGVIIWIIGFSFEVIADYQKNKFRDLPENKGNFINSGLWSMSRHPNYFGEIVIWIGIAIIALPALQEWRLLTLVSPVFVTFLLTKVSGIPLLERRADEKWGGQTDYEEYKKNTPVLIPKFLR